jgi:hypothetical protein
MHCAKEKSAKAFALAFVIFSSSNHFNIGFTMVNQWLHLRLR